MLIAISVVVVVQPHLSSSPIQVSLFFFSKEDETSEREALELRELSQNSLLCTKAVPVKQEKNCVRRINNVFAS